MKMFLTSSAFALLLTLSGVASAASGSLTEFKPGVMPVLVHVDSHGKVTQVLPSEEFAPPIERLLRRSIAQMIAKPAMRDGHAVSSQFIMKLRLHVTPRDDGDYDASFVYAGATPIPNGAWYWDHVNGHRLVLVNDMNRRFSRPNYRHHSHIRDWPSHRSMSMPSTTRASTASSRSAKPDTGK